MMMYSEKQMEYSELILSTLFNNGGRMKESDVCDVLDEKYGEETIDPALQIESLIVTEGIIERDGAFLLLTKEGKKAARKGFGKYLKRQDWLGRVRENKDVVSLAASIGTIIGILLTMIAQCS